ncbi:hypothetical protein MUU72_20980 [Streptomyces sp. RS10V-4]|nr:hypothetical protein [Streptomyces rhizoryzae]MCK7625542.1 hypothetical protein [Streptomyces rhizoryzae]
MSERAAPFYCPYCGDEDLRPGEDGHRAWECRACNRAFRLEFRGLLAPGAPGPAPSGAATGTPSAARPATPSAPPSASDGGTP